ncbi:MAG: FAD/NAD(P)-binding protein [Dehalococcoidia bacterium]|nr:MAG: FAD/NAD(P)-binding protein [Dehalococcoidia bacterium]
MDSTSTGWNDIYLPEMATLLRSEPMTADERFFECKLDSGKELGHMPGQFVEVSVLGIGEAPFSISSSPTQTGSFQMVVRNVGNVTHAMHGLKSGDKIGIRGPFGTHFPVEDEMRGKDIVFICGGLGRVPVRSAINYVLDNRDDYGEVTILYGTKSPAERLFLDEVEAIVSKENVKYLETVDRGDEEWTGNVGVITTLMTDMMVDPRKTVAVICGPPVMFKFAIMSLYKMGMVDKNIFVSLERHMKCGVGKCGHCQIDGLYVCQDGPVFRFADIAEVQEAIQ